MCVTQNFINFFTATCCCIALDVLAVIYSLVYCTI